MTRWFGALMATAASLALAPLAVHVEAQEAPQLIIRYNIEFNPINYPQKTPQEAIKSVATALDGGRYNYLLAHLADPRWVDPRVVEHQGVLFPREVTQAEEDEIAREINPMLKKKKETEKMIKDRARILVAFNRLVTETKKHIDEDPVLLRELRLMARDGQWDIEEDRAIGTLKGSPRKVVMRKRENRWFMDEKN